MLVFIAVGIIALLFASYFAADVLRKGKGSGKMLEVSAAIKEGSVAFLNRQYRSIALFAVLVAAIIYIIFDYVAAIAFIAGAFLSALAGYIGMMISIKANVKVANAANKLGDALHIAFRAGAVNGISIVALGIIGLGVLYYIYPDPSIIVSFGFGASLVSLFARVGGGIYTKAADVGADLVGKIEKGIPEDDPRNPAVIADNVGDNVGDCAGMGADLFESYVVTILAAMLLAFAVSAGLVTYVLAIAAVGIIASLIGIFFVKASKKSEIWSALNRGLYVSAALSAIGFLAVSYYFNSMNLFIPALTGLATTLVISYVTEYYTSRDKKPVIEIARASETGAATNIITGLATGMQSTIIPVLTISMAIIISYYSAGVLGIAIAALGLLSITGMIMSIDSYGPITDNAGGIAEMAKMPKRYRINTDALDAVGNTTKATTKGVAIASAAISALALLAAFAEEVHLTSVDVMQPAVLVGLLVGAAIPFLFSSHLLGAVSRAAHLIVKEVRRQFKEIPGLMRGTAKPDYAKCVDISTKAALKELMKPALLAVITPILIGFLLGPEALAGLLIGSIASGLLLALMLATGGAAWDNAKKYIEIGNLGGKGSDAHKAAVVGDTVGDPCKDSAAPAINSLIKVMNTLSIVIAPLILAI